MKGKTNMDPKTINPGDEEEIQRQAAVRTKAEKIHQQAEQVMTDVEEYTIAIE